MSDDAGRASRGGVPAHGSAGPTDPTADPATDPGGLRIPAAPDRTTEPVALPSGPTAAPGGTAPAARRSRTGGLWVGLILSALVLLLLLVFILQNGEPVLISFFALEGVLPSGVALLLAAIAGMLLVAIPGSLRILQLRRAARRGTRPER
jgi:uncharacterized integral membrane protein